jgi:uncharacterized coiled-coil protein SlyX
MTAAWHAGVGLMRHAMFELAKFAQGIWLTIMRRLQPTVNWDAVEESLKAAMGMAQSAFDQDAFAKTFDAAAKSAQDLQRIEQERAKTTAEIEQRRAEQQNALLEGRNDQVNALQKEIDALQAKLNEATGRAAAARKRAEMAGGAAGSTLPNLPGLGAVQSAGGSTAGTFSPHAAVRMGPSTGFLARIAGGMDKANEKLERIEKNTAEAANKRGPKFSD